MARFGHILTVTASRVAGAVVTPSKPKKTTR